MISYFQAIVIGLIQGVTELFPISSLGHSVLVPAWLGWDRLVTAQSAVSVLTPLKQRSGDLAAASSRRVEAKE